MGSARSRVSETMTMSSKITDTPVLPRPVKPLPRIHRISELTRRAPTRSPPGEQFGALPGCRQSLLRTP